MFSLPQAAFIPSTEGDDDTSYFASRLPWNAVDEQLYTESHEYDDMTDTGSMSCYSSAHSSDLDEDVKNRHLFYLISRMLLFFELSSFVEIFFEQGDECGSVDP